MLSEMIRNPCGAAVSTKCFMDNHTAMTHKTDATDCPERPEASVDITGWNAK